MEINFEEVVTINCEFNLFSLMHDCKAEHTAYVEVTMGWVEKGRLLAVGCLVAPAAWPLLFPLLVISLLKLRLDLLLCKYQTNQWGGAGLRQ